MEIREDMDLPGPSEGGVNEIFFRSTKNADKTATALVTIPVMNTLLTAFM